MMRTLSIHCYKGGCIFLNEIRKAETLGDPGNNLATVSSPDGIPDLPPAMLTTIHDPDFTHVQGFDKLGPPSCGKPQQLILVHSELPAWLADHVHLLENGSVIGSEFEIDPESACCRAG